MSYKLTITNNCTGEVVLEKETEAIICSLWSNDETCPGGLVFAKDCERDKFNQTFFGIITVIKRLLKLDHTFIRLLIRALFTKAKCIESKTI